MARLKHALSLDADTIIQMDVDFSHQPRYIPDLLACLEHSDLVIGSRYVGAAAWTAAGIQDQ